MPREGTSALKVGAICLLSYVIGIGISPYILPIDGLAEYISPQPAIISSSNPNKNTSSDAEVSNAPSTVPNKSAISYKRMVGIGRNNGEDPFNGIDIVLHRNGEPDHCARQSTAADASSDGAPSSDKNDIGLTLSSTSKAILNAADRVLDGHKTIETFQKYDFDAAMTDALASSSSLLEDRGSNCGPTWEKGKYYLDHLPNISPMIHYCDMGIDKTPIQPDHAKLVRVPTTQSLPCHFHTREGLRITSLEQLAQIAREAKNQPGVCTEKKRNDDGTCGTTTDATNRRHLHLYAVPAGRVFIFAPKYIGEIFELPHVKVPKDLPVWLEVISLQPRVFDIFNFFDRDESSAIVDKALKETSETHRMKRSSTGASGYNVNSQRTSENGFDTHGKEAQEVKKRCMEILGFDTYIESLTDGLQVLRYNLTTAYVPHLDWIDDPQRREEHNFDSAGVGSNRFATILLYMSDLQEGDGGETVFTHGWPPGQAVEDHVHFDDALASLRESGDVTNLLKENSWEEKMVARCRSRLSVRPHSSRAVLFYSQNPDGSPDQNSLHGGCPVIRGTKWAANLWAWNAPRGGFPGAPVNQDVVERNRAAGKSPENDLQKKASFTNSKTDPNMRDAKLYFQETFWGNLGFGDPALNVNTYEGHQWNVKVGDKTLKQFVIDKRPLQSYQV